MAWRQKPTNACTSFIDGLIADIGCPHQKIDRRLSRRWTNDDWGSTRKKLGFEGAEASRRRHQRRRASPPPWGRFEGAAPTLPMYATPEKRRLLLQLGCRAHQPRAARTHERRRKRYFTAVLLTAAEVLRDICRRTEAAELNWVKDIPAAFDDSGVAKSCLNPPTLSCRWLCEIYDITSMTFDPIPNFTQFLTQFFSWINYKLYIFNFLDYIFTDALKLCLYCNAKTVNSWSWRKYWQDSLTWEKIF